MTSFRLGNSKSKNCRKVEESREETKRTQDERDLLQEEQEKLFREFTNPQKPDDVLEPI